MRDYSRNYNNSNLSFEMNRSERRIRNNRIRRQRELRKNIVLTIMTIFFVITFSFSLNSFLSDAKSNNEPVSYKYYKSITITKGDTLWSIAQENMDDEHYNSVKDYIKEVKRINSLHSDTISYGKNLIIPYYL